MPKKGCQNTCKQRQIKDYMFWRGGGGVGGEGEGGRGRGRGVLPPELGRRSGAKAHPDSKVAFF